MIRPFLLPAASCLLPIACYSLRKLFTGLAVADLIALKLNVTSAMNNAMPAAKKKIVQLTDILYAKLLSHLFTAHQANGDAINIAISTS